MPQDRLILALSSPIIHCVSFEIRVLCAFNYVYYSGAVFDNVSIDRMIELRTK